MFLPESLLDNPHNTDIPTWGFGKHEDRKHDGELSSRDFDSVYGDWPAPAGGLDRGKIS
jgi:hypothetical protein